MAGFPTKPPEIPVATEPEIYDWRKNGDFREEDEFTTAEKLKLAVGGSALVLSGFGHLMGALHLSDNIGFDNQMLTVTFATAGITEVGSGGAIISVFGMSAVYDFLKRA